MRASSANLHHELRTPLNAILGYCELLLEEASESAQTVGLEPGMACLIPDLEAIRGAAAALVALLAEHRDQAEDGGALSAATPVPGDVDFQIRTGLTAITGYTEMLQEDAEAAGYESWLEDLDRIHAAAGRFLIIWELAAESRSADTGETASGSRSGIARPPPSRRRSRSSAPAVGPGHLLIVDDDEANREVLARFLEQQGHTVEAAADGLQALEMLRGSAYDLVLLDILMPEMDGYDVLRRIKSKAAWRALPVIMISALDEIGSVVRCIEMGAEDYLPKPFDPVLLRARIGASLEKKRLRDQEMEYLRNVALVTAAAAAVESGQVVPRSLDEVAAREDGLGQLARVFQSMATEIARRELRLRQKVRDLSIELNEARKAHQVAEITQTEYFRRLQAEAQNLRGILDRSAD